MLGKLGLHDRELAHYQSMIGEFPDECGPVEVHGRTRLRPSAGRKKPCAAFRQAIKFRPTYGEAYWSLANLKTFRFEPRDVAAMRKALRGKLVPDDALHFHFALGKALEDRDDVANSFRHYSAGNAIRASQLKSGAWQSPGG